MSARAIKFLSKSAAAAGLLSAAAIIAPAIPASAASYVSLHGFLGTEQFTCAVATHGINIGPVSSAANGCANRVWLHQYLNGSGWAYCIPGHTNPTIPTRYQAAQQALVSANTASC